MRQPRQGRLALTAILAVAAFLVRGGAAYAQWQPATAPATAPPQQNQAPLAHFVFGAGPVAHSTDTPVSTTDAYTREKGYGFEPGAKVTATDRGGETEASRSGSCSSDSPFFFSAALPEG